MTSTSHQHKGRDVVLPALDVFIPVLTIAKDACGIPPAQIALGSASALLTMIRVRPPYSSADLNRLLTFTRIRWPNIKIMSTLDGIAAVCVKYFTGD